MKEKEIVERIRKASGKPLKGVKKGIGDDASVLEYDKNNYLLWASDMIVEGTHFTKKDSLEKVGRKAVSVNVSDIASMGGVPKYILVSAGLPRNITGSETDKLIKGIVGTSKKYGVSLIGGDTVRSKFLAIDVSIMGEVRKKHLVTRGGAKKGDLVLVTGPVRDGKKEHLSFIPRLKEAQFLVRKYKVNSMADTSDGIAVDMTRICTESNLGCKLFEEAIPLSKGLSVHDALYYGESFELLFTMARKEVEKLFKDNTLKKNCPYYIIGEVTGRKKGMKLISSGGSVKTLKTEGFQHL